MKKAQDLFYKYAEFSNSNTNYWNMNLISAEKAIEEAQKNAWNEAIEAAAENQRLNVFDYTEGSFKKSPDAKRFVIDDGNYVEVSKESILKLKK